MDSYNPKWFRTKRTLYVPPFNSSLEKKRVIIYFLEVTLLKFFQGSCLPSGPIKRSFDLLVLHPPLLNPFNKPIKSRKGK